MTRTLARRLSLIAMSTIAVGALLAAPLSATAYAPVGDIETGAGAENIVFSADGTTAWVSNSDANSVSRIDVDDSMETNELAVGAEPEGLALTPNGTELWVATGGIAAGTIEIIKTSDNTKATINTGGLWAWEVTFDAAGTFAFVSNYASGEIVKIDTTTRAVVDEIEIGGSPQSLALSADGQTLYATLTGSDAVARVDPSTMEQVGALIPVGDFPTTMKLSPDGDTVWVANNGGDVSVIDTSTNLVVDTVDVPEYLYGLTFDVDGYAWTSTETPNTLLRIDPVTRDIVSTLEFDVGPRGIASHPTKRVLYTAVAGSVEIVALTPVRLAGANRYETAVEISEAAFANPTGVTTVYVASGANYPDALAAGPVAAKVGAPVLLTRPEALPPVVAEEIARLDPDAIVLLGDQNSVSSAVLSALNTIAPTTRISGPNRFATGRALVASQFGAASADAVYLANGLNFPDALSGGGAAAHGGDPVILVNGSLSSLDAATLSLINSIAPSDIHILGGTPSISNGIQSQLSGLGFTVTRYAGANRYETSRLVNEAVFDEAFYAVYTTGVNYPDALAGTPFASEYNAPVYLVKPECVPPATLGELDRLNTAWVAVLGGPTTVSDNALNLGVCAS